MQKQEIVDPNGDILRSLPTTKAKPSQNELAMINSLFAEDKSGQGSAIQTLFIEFKNDIFIGILFFLFSLEQIDNLIQKFVPITQKNKYILLSVKSLSFVFIVWLIKNFWIAKL